MSLVTQTSSEDRTIIGKSPRANLLPPEILNEAKSIRLRRRLALLVVGAIVIVFAAYAYFAYQSGVSALALVQEQAQTAAITAEQNQYAEATTVTGQVQAAQAAQVVGAATEVDIEAFIGQIRDTLPDNSSITNLGIKMASPTAGFLTPVGGKATAVEVSFTVTVDSLTSISTWLSELADLTGYSDAAVGNVTDSEGNYAVTLTLQVDTQVLANRFVEPAAEETK